MTFWQETKHKLLHLGAAVVSSAVICAGIFLMTLNIVAASIGLVMVVLGIVLYVRVVRHMIRTYNLNTRL